MEFLKGLAFPTVALIIGGIMIFLAIVKKINIKNVKLDLTDRLQQLLIGIVGMLLIIGSFVLQFSSPNTNTPLDSAQSTISAMQTQLVLSSVTPNTLSPFPTTPITNFTSVPQSTFTITPTPPLTPILLTLTATQLLSIQTGSELFCINFYSVIIRTGPGDIYQVQSVLKNPNNLSSPDCLLFDFRMPDNSWIRIAPNQSNPSYSEYELGWVYSSQLRPNDFDRLGIYIPDSIKEGLYCITNRFGINIRKCPSNSCSITGTLSMRDCLVVDARTQDNQWVRVSKNQNDSKYVQFAEGWISICCIMPSEFSAEYQPFLRFYLDLLPIATPPPTPGG